MRADTQQVEQRFACYVRATSAIFARVGRSGVAPVAIMSPLALQATIELTTVPSEFLLDLGPTFQE